MIHVYLVSFTYSVIYLFLTLTLATLNYYATTYGRPWDHVIARLCYLLFILFSGLLF